MVEAAMYMFFVGAGTSAGVAVVGIVTWKIVQRSLAKQNKRKKGVV